MDTLSRKHRLRQQHQQQQQLQNQNLNHQALFETSCEGKENQVRKQQHQYLSSSPEDYDMSFNVTSYDDNANDNNNSREEEQFRVFKLVEIGQRRQEHVVNGNDVFKTQAPERIVGQQQNEQFNSNKKNKWYSGSSCGSISAAQQQPKRHHQQAGEVRKCNHRNVLPSDSTKSNNQYRYRYRYRNDDNDEEDDCDEAVLSNVHAPTLKHENDKRSIIHRQKQRQQQCQKNKQQYQVQIQQQNIYHQNGTLLSNENGGEHSTSCSTTRSTAAYSSGFASEESGDRFHQSTTFHSRRNSDANDGDQNENEEDDFDVGFAERCANKLRQHSRQRSRVIADLDRLMVNAGRSSTSPAESYLSSCANSSTKAHMTSDNSNMNHTNEFDYSTLCRDEFSSFIPVQPNIISSPQNVPPLDKTNKQQQHQQKSLVKQTSGGPVLVGIHHESNDDNYTELSVDSGESNSESYCDEQDAFGLQEDIESSSSCITTSSKNDTDPSIDKEIVIVGNYDQYNHEQRSCFQMAELSPGSEDKLSDMLEIYLDRVESLLKLTRGDNSISLEEAFGKDNEIQVSAQFKTAIEFSPIKQNRSATKVIQEVKMIDETNIDDDMINNENLCNIERSTASIDFETMLLASPQTSAKLNWDRDVCEITDFSNKLKSLEHNDEDLLEQRKRLEASLLNRFLELDEFKSSCLSRSSGDILVNSIRRHVNEFVEEYNAYQRELKVRTTFASDWHQNWLFAFKRPNELSLSGRVGGTKRAKMSVTKVEPKLDLVSERPTNETATNHLDLIEYSTLILDKFKPVKLTYLTPKIDRNYITNEITTSTNESIEACYEAQEERLKELKYLALESSRQIDVCRLLMFNFDDNSDYYDDKSNYGLQEGRGLGKNKNGDNKNVIRKRRALLISYNTSLLIQRCSGSKFTFSSYGYLFQCNLPAAETSYLNSNTAKRIRKDILLKLQQKVELKDKRFRFNGDNCLDISERIKFLVSVGKNVALINNPPVIQFCIKVSGSLPMKVRWFRRDKDDDDDKTNDYAEQEISSIYVSHKSRRRNMKVKEGLIDGANLNWPIEMQANFDYEYQTEWSSWFRFRRCQDDILFEIRDADLENDYGRRYKCVVENYCSLEECNFSLTRRNEISIVESKMSGFSFNGDGKIAVKRDKHALLRTWSQRTLHKLPPQTTMQQVESSKKEQDELYDDSLGRAITSRIEASEIETDTAVAAKGQDENDLLNKCCSTLKTIGRLSATVAAIEEDRFGSNFPYHPENLLKRLEQNKFSVPLKYKLLSQNNGQPVEKIDATELVGKMDEIEVSGEHKAKSTHEDHMQENLSHTISPQIQSTNKSQILHSETYDQMLDEIQLLDQQDQAYHFCDLSQRHLKSREAPDKKKNGKLTEDQENELASKMASSVSQVRFGIIYQK